MTAAVSFQPSTLRFINEVMPAIRWAPEMSLSEWADENAYIATEVSAEPGRWNSLPYQRGIMDAMTDPNTESVTLMKSARVGYTAMISHLIGYHIHHDPCPIMMVQPTIEMAKDYSKEEFACMVRDVNCLHGLVREDDRRSRNTLSKKKFPGGSFRLIGANSPAGFRKVTIRIMIFDEVGAYKREVGTEGNPIALGTKRTETFWNRKIIAGSTPTDGFCRIESMYEDGDQRRYHVPCPHCGHKHPLEFKNLEWPEGMPRLAYFKCPKCEEKITSDKKTWMIENGEWVAEKPFAGHASFHIWAAYSYAPNASWGHIAEEFMKAQKAGPETLKTFVNTWLGEVWKEAVESPDWNPLYARREAYGRGVMPTEGRVVTAGVDVQKDRLEVEIVAWGAGLESWTLDYIILEGDTANINGPAWNALDGVLATQYLTDTGIAFPIAKMGIDANFYTQHVINWCRSRGIHSRVIPIKGTDRQAQIINSPKSTDVRANGKRKRHGARLWFVGVSHIKKELYGWFRLPVPTEENPVPHTGFCHFGEFLNEQYFQMLTSEDLIRTSRNGGGVREEWRIRGNQRNEALDTRVYNRAMAYLCGVDMMAREADTPSPTPAQPARKRSTRQSELVGAASAGSSAPAAGRKRRRSSYW